MTIRAWIHRAALLLTVAAGALTLAGPALAAPGTAAAGARGNGSGWLRLAHLSPNTPPVDIYLYSFGRAGAMIVLRHVAYGTVSPYERVASGDYTVAMRAAGSAPASKPVLSATVDIAAGQSYTAAGTGLYQALRLQVRHDRLAVPHGKALLQVIQASLHQQRVMVSFGLHPVASNLAFGRATGFRAVSPGRRVLRAAGPGEHAAAAVTLAAGSIHTVAVLDEPGRLAIRVLADAAGGTRDPAGGPATGLGGTAPQPGSALTPWITAASCGLLLIAVGLTRPRWSRPTHPSRPAATASASTGPASTGPASTGPASTGPARPRHAGTQPAGRAR